MDWEATHQNDSLANTTPFWKHMGGLDRTKQSFTRRNPKKLPDQLMAKINSDGACDKQRKKSGTGIICRNAKGEILGVKMTVNDRIPTPFVADAIACLQFKKVFRFGNGVAHELTKEAVTSLRSTDLDYRLPRKEAAKGRKERSGNGNWKRGGIIINEKTLGEEEIFLRLNVGHWLYRNGAWLCVFVQTVGQSPFFNAKSHIK
ncbi:hypothetical protein Gorai_021417, partial [Gossypium raimondii]|nr:hypothetical protein [Gossypium raimondii]